MLLTEEQKQQDLYYEGWEIDYPINLIERISRSVDKRFTPNDHSLEVKVEYLLQENEQYKEILLRLVSKLNTLGDINYVLGTEIKMITK